MMFVCAGGNPATFDDRSVFGWLRRLARKGVAIGGISGGPYIVARAGLFDQRRATLHWEHLPAFREAFPDIEVGRRFSRSTATASPVLEASPRST